MTEGLLLSKDCVYFATVDVELVIYNTRDNHTVMVEGGLALLLQAMRSIDAGFEISTTHLRRLLQKENIEFDDVSLNLWIGKLLDLHLISISEK